MKNKNIMEYQLYTNASKIDSSMIRSDKKRLFFAVNLYPLHFLRTLPLNQRTTASLIPQLKLCLQDKNLD